MYPAKPKQTNLRQYLRGVFIGFDNLLSSLAGVNPDIAISAAAGYYSRLHGWTLWILLERFIDWAFKPKEKDHCWDAHKSDSNEDYRYVPLWSIFWLWVFCILTVPFIALSIRIYTAVK